MNKQETINKYEDSCNLVLEKINNLYFEGEADTNWAGSEIGGVAIVADYFFDMHYMITALRYEATEKQFFDYYVKSLDGEPMNFKNYLLNEGFLSE